MLLLYVFHKVRVSQFNVQCPSNKLRPLNIIIASLIEKLQHTETFTVCWACPWADAEEFSLSWDKTFFCKLFHKIKKTLGRGQKSFFGCSTFKFLLCMWLALRMMLTNFNCYEAKNFYLGKFVEEKKIHT
jgi:hypothetical protein